MSRPRAPRAAVLSTWTPVGVELRTVPYRRWGKRAFDVIASAVLLLALAPVMLVVAVVTWVAHRAPPLFEQQRPGLNGKAFTILKFRSMREAVGPDGRPLADHLRMTRVGNALRSSSLDELPELINVLKGDMSLVGPRPLLMDYLPRYTPEQARRHEVRPGITGLAQVSGRNAISWEEKFAYDLEYLDRLSFAFDLKILALTAWRVVRPEGVNAEEQVTMPEFWGTAAESNGAQPDAARGRDV